MIPNNQGEKRLRGVVLDQKRQYLADVTILLTPDDREGSFYPHAGAPTAKIQSDARYLKLEGGDTEIELLNPRFHNVSGETHFHFSY